MADEPDKPKAETIPSDVGGLSAIGSANAPFVYFEFVPTYGYNFGIANVTLEAARRFLAPDNKTVIADRVIVAHLRMSLNAAMSLRDALNGIEALTRKPEGQPN